MKSASQPTPVECAAIRSADACALQLETKEQNWRMTLDVGGESIPRTLREMLIVRSQS
jgi:hypothetical protein